MKVITRNELIKLPNGTVFSRFFFDRSYVFDGLVFIKESVSDKDIKAHGLTTGIHDDDAPSWEEFKKRAMEGQSLRMDFESPTPESYFDECCCAYYAVWDKQDVMKLIRRLQTSLADLERYQEQGKATL